MAQKMENNVCQLRKIILHTKEPLIIREQLSCGLINWTLVDWIKELQNELLTFRCGKNQYTKNPQWESKCTVKKVTLQEFLKNTTSNSDEWWYFDYKYLCEWFTNKERLKEQIDWSQLGFSEIKANESTIWIGSKGAHTPCHMDTYGCNMILQVFGRKQWLLFPPEENLKPSRIPFEESSVYSKLNFFSPNVDDFRGVSHCRKVILNPGEVLVVPNKWWHYVENLETAISINAWLPLLPQDDYQRIKESIATILVGSIMQNQKEELKNVVFNPNMTETMIDFKDGLAIMEVCKEKCGENNKVPKTAHPSSNFLHDDVNVEGLIAEHKNIFKIPVLSEKEIKDFFKNQSERFDKVETNCAKETNNGCKELTAFLNIITDDEVLDLIAKKFVEKR